MPDEIIQKLSQDLPDADSAIRFFAQFSEQNQLQVKKLRNDSGLLSDVLALAAFSPLLAATILQNPDYVPWLKRQKTSQKVREKPELLESLARFSFTNSELETNVLLARFRRRELLRIYLRDIRNLGTIAEITEEISNLADAILEYALRIAIQELENRYGIPLETDENNRDRQSTISIVALGKLGSKELNYSSDIDLLFLYSAEGVTSGKDKNIITNREYFIKLAELITKIVGGQGGEGAAYRVDLRLRPNGRVGALAISLSDAVKYYETSARAWERQVLIRSRVAAGDFEIFHRFFEEVKSTVFSVDETVENALQNVRLSKEQINVEKSSGKGFHVKLGAGGIREIEFIAQALQLAYGGADDWIRAPHTLISLNRLADRKLLTESELTQLFEAYTFLRRLEHRLQMEHGLQTHLVADELEKRIPLAKRMDFIFVADFNTALKIHTENVNKIFVRIFGNHSFKPQNPTAEVGSDEIFYETSSHSTDVHDESKAFKQIISSLEKSDVKAELTVENLGSIRSFCDVSPPFASMIAANPELVGTFLQRSNEFVQKDYVAEFLQAVQAETDFKGKLSALRKSWAKCLLEIVENDVFERISLLETKALQTKLAEASIETAIEIVRTELESKFSTNIKQFHFAVLGLGKLGGGGMDYGSDLDLVLIYDDTVALPISNVSHAEFYNRAVEVFVTALSSLTRDGMLYRVDLRLRPDGNSGTPCISKSAFLNYLQTRAAIWEWLAYVKLRGVAGDLELAKSTETEAKAIIHEKAQNADSEELRLETLRVRERLANEKSVETKGKEIDIKFGEGGMLDIYFAMRFLQLRDNVPDDPENRSSANMLFKLYSNHSFRTEQLQSLTEGYDFFSKLDHNLRLVVGRTTTVPTANKAALQTITRRLGLESIEEFYEYITMHRLNIRDAYLEILKSYL
jgi:glutamate-ammonia-ligase adenylyltransferase